MRELLRAAHHVVRQSVEVDASSSVTRKRLECSLHAAHFLNASLKVGLSKIGTKLAQDLDVQRARVVGEVNVQF